MSQFDFGTIDPFVTNGEQLADMLNEWRDAIHTLHRGSTRPTYVQPGMMWIDDSAGSTSWVLKVYLGGIGDVSLAIFNTVAGSLTWLFVNGISVPLINVQGTAPEISINDTNNPVDQKRWSWSLDGTGNLLIRPLTDGGGSTGITFQLNRDGTMPGIGMPTGAVVDYVGSTAPAGWVLGFGTIGSAASGATNRAHADTLALFSLLWNSYSNTEAPVSGGRGANAAADFAANKNIGGLDYRGYVRGGLDNIGGSAAGRLTGFTTRGVAVGSETTALTPTHLPSILHQAGTGVPGNQTQRGVFGDGASVGTIPSSNTQPGGTGAGHSNVQATKGNNVIIKL
jgi:hypothetical protein